MVLFFCLIFILLPLVSLAQDFVPLVGIPFMNTPTANTTLGDYANAFYIAAISLGAVIAVLKIIFAGVKYMLSDVITDKSAAKADIKGALLGLILIIGAVLLLETISPNITNLQAFNLDALTITRPPTSGGASNITEAPIDLSTTSGADQAEYIAICESQNRQYIIETDAEGRRWGTCRARTGTNLDPVISSNPDIIEAARAACHDDDRAYTENPLPNGETQINCGIVCQGGVDVTRNQCQDDSIIIVDPGNYTFNCGTDVGCASYCLRWYGEVSNPSGPDYGQCTGSQVEYVF